MNSTAVRLTACGALAFLFPPSNPVILLLPLLVCAELVHAGLTQSGWKGTSSLLVVGIAIGAGLAELTSLPVAVAIAAAGILVSSRPDLVWVAVAFLVAQMSSTATLVGWVAGEAVLGPMPWTEPATYLLVLCGLMVLLQPSLWRACILSLVIGLPLSWWLYWIAAPVPWRSALVAFAALPVILLVRVPARRFAGSTAAAIILAAVMGLHWAATPPKSFNSYVLAVPTSKDEYESRYFINMKESLQFLGLKVRDANRLEDVEAGAVVILPWLSTSSFAADWDQLIEDASRRDITLLALAEHSDIGGVATRLNAQLRATRLQDDLTSPPGNRDQAGLLRVPAAGLLPSRITLNRGGSIAVTGFGSRVIALGDGWLAEPTRGEPAWAGDYRWQPGDRTTGVPLIAAEGRATRWVVAGDNSFATVSHIVANPAAFLSFLRAATLWPALALDSLLAAYAVALLVTSKNALGRGAGAGCAAVAAVCLLLLSAIRFGVPAPSATSQLAARLQLSPFDPDNINLAVQSLLPELTDGRVVLVPHRKYIAERELGATGSAEIHFGLVDGTLKIGGVSLSDCWRIGRLAAGSATINDGQSCVMAGNGEVLLGSASDLQAVRTTVHGQPIVVVLDRAFLANARENPANNKWVSAEISALSPPR